MRFEYDGKSLSGHQAARTGTVRGVPAKTSKSRKTALAVLTALIAAVAVALWLFCAVGRDGGETGAAGGACAGESLANRAVEAGPTRDRNAFFTPSEAEINQLYAHVVTSPVVTENRQYISRLRQVPLVYDATNDVVNACAARLVVDGKEKFCTLVFGGAARYARLVGLAAAAEEAGAAGALKTLMEKMPRSMCSRCSEEDVTKVVEECGLSGALANPAVVQKAMSYSSGTLIGVLAHESGHHVFGHLLDEGEKTNMEVQRNHEREADSFASSVISTSAFGEHIFSGTLFWHYAVAVQSDGDGDAGRSHPLSRERFSNFVRANPSKAAAMGVSPADLDGGNK